LIEPAKRFDIRGKAYIETPLKYYYVDLGLRNARINFRQVEMTHSMENVIYNELRMRQFNVYVGSVIISERNEKGIPVRKQLEVDFVCNKGSRRYYIQSAYAIPDEAKRLQEERPLKHIDDSFKKIIITRDTPRAQYTEEGILMINVFEFLMNPDSIDY
jgi:predicted AAA+ superfamily ATPase